MPMETFVVGDVVRLKSGGPPMVVSEVFCTTHPDTEESVVIISCRWFDAEHKPQLIELDSREIIKDC